ncbi:transglutaminase domain-containing protein [Bacillus sp. 1P06AnD]|uniref:transglutaminase domain-containing protein n=1 Tax=Bacillus sp. 1P06AnD TaxID=3132208 RepID=UPI0039A3420C
MYNNNMGKTLQVYFYLLGYLMLLEWLRPLKVIADVGYLSAFLLFSALPFIMYLFSVKWMWKTIILLGYMLLAVYYIYFSSIPFLNPEWFIRCISEMIVSCTAIFTGDFEAIADSFKSILFFVLLWIMTYLIHYWIVMQRSIFLFFFISVLFITILDTFTPYDGNGPIIRLFLFGMLMIGSLTLYRKVENGQWHVSKAVLRSWFVPFVSILAIAIAIGFAGPKPGALWPDPVPFIKSYSDKFSGNSSQVSKVGYGTDDRRLGGGFEKDDTVVFTADVGTKHYWRIESKDYYTGQGWTEPPDALKDEQSFRKLVPQDSDNSHPFFSGKIEKTQMFNDRVHVKLLYNHVPYPNPGSLISLKAEEKNSEGIEYSYNPLSKKVKAYNDNKKTMLKQYSLDYRQPIFNVDELKEADELYRKDIKDKGFTSGADLDSIDPDSEFGKLIRGVSDSQADELQLPDTVPYRVKELAKEITKDRKNRYDKVKAIEQYFDRPEFKYDRKNIPYPKAGQDFVDQFLFDTKKGYCDHFSTSMAVMLRSIGIEARWVKGYTPGEMVKNEGGRSTYQVTNNNAHSWVEVYFPYYGWVPFEPTKGFSDTTRFVYNNSRIDGSNTDAPKANTPASGTTTVKQEPKKPVKKDPMEEQASSSKAKAAEKKADFPVWQTILSGIVIIALAFGVYALRGKWLPRLWIAYYRRQSSFDSFGPAYKVLLKQLKRYGIAREPDQTLRSFAQYVDQYFSIDEMASLTAIYEQYIYSGKPVQEEWPEVYKLWKKVMKKTIT